MRRHTAAVFQALFVVFLWATSWVFIKIGLHHIPPVTFAGLRYFLAFLCLLTVLLFSRARNELRTLSTAAWIQFLMLGVLLYAVTQCAVFIALSYLPAMTVNLLWSFSSVLIAMFGIALLSERPRVLQWIGMSLAILGTAIYFSPISIPANQTAGFVVAVLGVVANAASSILGRNINRAARHSPLVVTVISMGAGSILLLVAGFAFEPAPSLNFQNWMIIVWLAVINTALAFTLWNHTLRTLTAMESSIINSTMLVWIAIFAVIFLGETMTGKEAIGLVATSIGTIIVQLRNRMPVIQDKKSGNLMQTLKCQAVLFDLDGTLVESTSFIERLWQDWGLQHGVSPQYMSEVMHGRPAVEIISIVAPHLTAEDEVYALETDEISRMEGMRTYDGAHQLLSSLPRGRWAIVTSGSLRVASARVNYASLPVPEVFVTADDVQAGKPAPDAYLLAAQRLHVKPENCIVIEDSPAGVQAGKSAGMRVIAIASSHSKDELSQADVIAGQLAEIRPHVAGNQISIHFR